MIFLDSTKNNGFQNIKIKLNSPNLDDPGVLSSDFPGLRIFVVSMTSTASTASVASMTSTASFHIANRAETLQRQDAKKKNQ